MSSTILKKFRFTTKTIVVASILTVITYNITLVPSKISSHTEAYDGTIYMDGFYTTEYYPVETVRKPFEPLKPRDPRAIRLERFLKVQQSTLALHADLIIELSDTYKIDYKIPVAIAGLESGYCAKVAFQNNCWGYGSFSWPTLEAGIKGYLSKMNVGYFSKGKRAISDIAPIYNTANTEEFIAKLEYHYNLIP